MSPFKLLVPLLALAPAAFGAAAAPNIVLRPADDFLIDVDGSVANAIPAKEETALSVKLTNASKRSLTVTHVAFTAPAIFVPISPIKLDPSASAEVPLLIDGRKFAFPNSIELRFRVIDRETNTVTTKSGFVQIDTADRVRFSPSSIIWTVGGDYGSRDVQVIALPRGTKIVGFRASDSAFAATINGDKITVTVTDTFAPRSGTIAVLTEPASVSVIPVAVVSVPKSPK